jgi:hypothetical protein
VFLRFVPRRPPAFGRHPEEQRDEGPLFACGIGRSSIVASSAKLPRPPPEFDRHPEEQRDEGPLFDCVYFATRCSAEPGLAFAWPVLRWPLGRPNCFLHFDFALPVRPALPPIVPPRTARHLAVIQRSAFRDEGSLFDCVYFATRCSADAVSPL